MLDKGTVGVHLSLCSLMGIIQRDKRAVNTTGDQIHLFYFKEKQEHKGKDEFGHVEKIT